MVVSVPLSPSPIQVRALRLREHCFTRSRLTRSEELSGYVHLLIYLFIGSESSPFFFPHIFFYLGMVFHYSFNEYNELMISHIRGKALLCNTTDQSAPDEINNQTPFLFCKGSARGSSIGLSSAVWCKKNQHLSSCLRPVTGRKGCLGGVWGHLWRQLTQLWGGPQAPLRHSWRIYRVLLFSAEIRYNVVLTRVKKCLIWAKKKSGSFFVNTV